MQQAFTDNATCLTNSNKKHLSGYQLTTKLIRGGIGKLGLNGNAREVLLYLSTCYNEAKGVVYPHQKTIAEALGISEIGVKRAIAELLTKGCILKSKHRKNANEYVITNKVFEAVNIEVKPIQEDTSNNHDDTSKKYHDDTSHVNHEVRQFEVIQQQKVVAFSSFKRCNSVKLEDVPNIIKDNENIKNPCGYWASLDENAKNEYIKKEKQKEQIRLKKIEFEKQEEIRKKQEAKELEEIRKQPPFWETCNRQEAVKHLQNFKNMRQLLHTGYRKMLIDKYNIDVMIEVLQ